MEDRSAISELSLLALVERAGHVQNPKVEEKDTEFPGAGLSVQADRRRWRVEHSGQRRGSPG